MTMRETSSSLLRTSEHVAPGRVPPSWWAPAAAGSKIITSICPSGTILYLGGLEHSRDHDVLDGNWSLKLGDRNGKNNLTFNHSQNFRFEPGVTYTVAFDYQMGTAGDYEVISRSRRRQRQQLHGRRDAKQARGTTATCKFTLVGDPTGQTWIGLRRTNALPITPGSGTNADIFAEPMILFLTIWSLRSVAPKRVSWLRSLPRPTPCSRRTGKAIGVRLQRPRSRENRHEQPEGHSGQVDGAVQTLDEAIKALDQKKILL